MSSITGNMIPNDLDRRTLSFRGEKGEALFKGLIEAAPDDLTKSFLEAVYRDFSTGPILSDAIAARFTIVLSNFINMQSVTIVTKPEEEGQSFTRSLQAMLTLFRGLKSIYASKHDANGESLPDSAGSLPVIALGIANHLVEGMNTDS